jgi:hypothetical protein
VIKNETGFLFSARSTQRDRAAAEGRPAEPFAISKLLSRIE